MNNALCVISQLLIWYVVSERAMASLVTKHVVFGRNIFIKRDDLLNYNGISGNKVRKLGYFMQYISELNASNQNSTATVFGRYGGCQSNAMYAISSMVSANKNCKFVYFVKNMPLSLNSSPTGNLKSSLLQHGMIVRKIESNFIIILF